MDFAISPHVWTKLQRSLTWSKTVPSTGRYPSINLRRPSPNVSSQADPSSSHHPATLFATMTLPLLILLLRAYEVMTVCQRAYRRTKNWKLSAPRYAGCGRALPRSVRRPPASCAQEAKAWWMMPAPELGYTLSALWPAPSSWVFTRQDMRFCHEQDRYNRAWLPHTRRSQGARRLVVRACARREPRSGSGSLT